MMMMTGERAVESDSPSSLIEHILTPFVIVGLSSAFIYIDLSFSHVNKNEQTVEVVFFLKKSLIVARH